MTKRTQILIAAEYIIGKQGLHVFSMQNLADTAGVAAGTIYRYFANKEALMNELQKFIREEAAKNLFLGWQDSFTAQQKYNLLWKNTFDCVLANPKRLTVIEMLHCEANINQTEITLFENNAFKPLIDFYQNGIETQRFLKWQLFALVAISLDSAISLAKQIIRGRLITDQTQLDQVRDASWAIIQNPHFNTQE
ncbi:TetR/AcrR family transcriptional regulator [Psychromonas sp.]|nr:TetR/AcrR family transcriptional regulator [Psychromonas sp.]